MATVNVNVRIDAELKQSADEAMQIAGVSPTQAVTLLYQYIAENKRLPFVVTTSVKTPDDLTSEATEILATALAVALNMEAGLKDEGQMPGKTMLEYYKRLDFLFTRAKEKTVQPQERRELTLAMNNLNKLLTVIVDFTDFGYGYDLVRLLPSEKNNFNIAIFAFERSMFELVGKEAEE
ncbi:type II toxin-antitoxin system RelB/DinJ family antitoxin [Citrobacter freundii]|uniref:type II toxin-antitoxin system RelB/DinJ family antitoxin n=1 Tax=Citrobacter freundii complex TaxID=1344959 RepID=UPI00174E6630|nr:type II toxin-antitoxin system RelB/DinJ family antitoxin [Citrobacter freundii]EIM6682269.1 type II toxin-antitoxin system RelB/DinJ family antitoxin [Salmonella enterica]EIT4895113.1 type II toxin-antitoxin system RelB/DinJ family antitoxin [Salmonella enterica]MBD5754012.1 type II toxin-antitoxin system RelB/DinJ family antitoxin [Citrobacter freundii]MDT9810125.1 type II toxin-antitoxin system RelB/DinJ family antitoxin [Citrobacter freundii]MDT9846427.1 type II toxin-antitoxin system R